MKTTQVLTISLLLITILACSKLDNHEAANTQVEQPPMAEKPMEVMPAEAEMKPSQMLPNEIKADDTTTFIEQDDSGKKVLFWYDPMLEDRHFSKSGQSPFMDMKLAPHYATDADKGAKP